LVPEREIFTGLLDRGMARAEAEEIAHLALGRPGRAIKFFEEGEDLEKYKERSGWLPKILKNNLAAQLQMIEEYVGEFSKEESITEALEVLDIWEGVARDMMNYSLGNREEIVHRFLESALGAASQSSGGKILSLTKGFEEARQMILANVNYELAFKNIFLKI